MKLIKVFFNQNLLNIFLILFLTFGFTLTSLSIISNLENRFKISTKEFLAADMLVNSTTKINEKFINLAKQNNLKVAKKIKLRSVIFYRDQFLLSTINGVSENYPLRGSIEILTKSNYVVKTSEIPINDEVWISTEFAQQTKVKIGDKIEIGDKNFRVNNIIYSTPDKGSNFFSFIPEVLINISSIKYSNLILPGSRVNYTDLFAGKDNDLNNFRKQIENKLSTREKIIDTNSSNRLNFYNNIKHFITLVNFVVFLLGGSGIFLASNQYLRKYRSTVAILKVIGLKSKKIKSLLIINFLILWLFSGLLGSFLGYGIYLIVNNILNDFLIKAENSFSYYNLLVSFVVNGLFFLIFCFIPIISLIKVEPLIILRQIKHYSNSKWLMFSVPILVICLLIIGNIKISLIFIFALLSIALLLGLIWHILFKKIRIFFSNSYFITAYNSINSLDFFNKIQIFVFIILTTLLVILFSIMNSILSSWSKEFGKNSFFIQIQQNQIEPINKIFQTEGLTEPNYFKITRGRIVAINGTNINLTDNKYKNINALNRELNLTSLNKIPDKNELLSGQQFDLTNNEYEISIEKELATDDLNVGLGDNITFNIAGRDLVANITSIRVIDWKNFEPNFYIIFKKGNLKNYPASFMFAFNFSENKKYLRDLIQKKFTNISVLKVDNMIEKAKTIIITGSKVIQIIVAFLVVLCCLLLVSGIKANLHEKIRINTIYRIIGASNKFILTSLIIENITLGFLVGLIAITVGTTTSFIIIKFIIELDFYFNFYLICTPLFTIVLFVLLSFNSNRLILNTPPNSILKNN